MREMTQGSDPGKHNSFNPGFVSALGELTIDFATLEEVLRESIWGILGGNEERAQIMTAGLSFQILVEKWAALFAQKFNHVVLPEPVNQLRVQLLSINDRRNRFVHSVWGLDVGSGSAIAERRRAKAGVGIDWQVHDVDATEVRKLLSEILVAQDRLTELFETADTAFKVMGPNRRK